MPPTNTEHQPNLLRNSTEPSSDETKTEIQRNSTQRESNEYSTSVRGTWSIETPIIPHASDSNREPDTANLVLMILSSSFDICCQGRNCEAKWICYMVSWDALWLKLWPFMCSTNILKMRGTKGYDGGVAGPYDFLMFLFYTLLVEDWFISILRNRKKGLHCTTI